MNLIKSISIASDLLQSDGCKLSVLLRLNINSTPLWRLINLASREASTDNTAIRIKSSRSRGYDLSISTSLVKIVRDCCNVLYVTEK